MPTPRREDEVRTRRRRHVPRVMNYLSFCRPFALMWVTVTKPPAQIALMSPARSTFINSQDDALAWPKPVHRTYPATVIARMENTIHPFMQHSGEVNHTLMEILRKKLGFKEGKIAELHHHTPRTDRLLAGFIRNIYTTTSFIIKAHENRPLSEAWKVDSNCPFCRIVRGETPAYL